MKQGRWRHALTVWVCCAACASGSAMMGEVGTVYADQTAAGAAEAPTSHTVTVTGFGSLPVSEDIAQITLNVSIGDSTVADMEKDVAKFKSQVRTLLGKLRIPNTDIQISDGSFNLNGSPSLSESVVVTMPNTSKARTVMDALASMPGAYQNEWINVQYYPQNIKNVRMQVFQAALDDAKTQATLFATSVGETIGRVMSISTMQQPYGYMQPGPYPNSPGIGGVSLQFGQNGVFTASTQVTVTYELVPQAQ